MSAAAIQQSHHDSPVAAAMLAAGWSDAQVGAAFRAALGAKATPESHLVGEGDKVVTVEPVVTLNSDKTGKGDIPAKGATNRKAIARKVLSLVGGISGGARRVGGLLVEHYNLQTRRCDPAHVGLAHRLNVSTRTIIRKIAELESVGLIDKTRHGSFSHRNAYGIDWEYMSALGLQCDAAMESGAKTGMPSVSPLGRGRQKSHSHSDKVVTQNHVMKPDITNTEFVDSKQRAKADFKRRQGSLMLPIAGGRAGLSDGEIAREKAHERLWNGFNKLFRGTDGYQVLLAEVMANDGAWQAAVTTEKDYRGTGLEQLVRAMVVPKKTGTDPP